jgi:hypothetical protein
VIACSSRSSDPEIGWPDPVLAVIRMPAIAAIAPVTVETPMTG